MSISCPTCGDESFSSRRSMKTHHKMKHGESLIDKASLTCENCGGEYHRHPSHASNSRFCSKECHSESRDYSEIPKLTGADHPNWKGGVSIDNSRKQVLNRDNYTCQRCGCEVENGHRESQRSVEVHHLIPRAAGGPDTMENLVTLCVRCHREAHRDMKRIHETHPALLEELQNIVCRE